MNLEVFRMESLVYKFEDAKSVLEEKLNPNWIKERKQGNVTLSYIEGHTVIRLLNKAFNYQWNFEIISEEIVASQPKPITQYNPSTKRKEYVYNPDGSIKVEPQPPVVKVLGRLTVPGLGIKEQYGSKVLIGGATEQESAFKAAATDALKKCASMFGIGLELYGGDEDFVEPQQQQQTYGYVSNADKQQYNSVQQPVSTPSYTPPQATTVQQATNAPADPNAWDPNDINRLKELKQILGITDNHQLDPYVREFLDSPDVTYMNITPQNIKAFNVFMSKKAEQL